jgi:hypothetical protein
VAGAIAAQTSVSQLVCAAPCHGQCSSCCEWMHITRVFPIGRSWCEPLHNRARYLGQLWYPGEMLGLTAGVVF